MSERRTEAPTQADGDSRDNNVDDSLLGKDFVRRLAAAGLDADAIAVSRLPLGSWDYVLQRVAPALTLAGLASLTWHDAEAHCGLNADVLQRACTEAQRLLERAEDRVHRFSILDAPSDVAPWDWDEEPLLGVEYSRQLLATGLDPRNVNLSTLGLSTRTANALARAQLTTLAQVLVMTPSELLAIRNFGQRCLTELQDRAREVGEVAQNWCGGDSAEGIAAYDEPLHKASETVVRMSESSCPPAWRASVPPPEPALAQGYLQRLTGGGVDPTTLNIGALGLSARSRNCLYSAGIRTVAQLAERSVDDLMAIRNLGATCLAEVRRQSERLLEHLSAGETISAAPEMSGAHELLLRPEYLESLDAAGLDPTQLELARLGLSHRLCGALEYAGVRHVADLGTVTEDHLLAKSRISARHLEEVRRAIAQLRLMALALSSSDPFAGIWVVLEDLPARARMVLVQRFGLDCGQRRTLEEVGVILDEGVSRERVRQIEADALDKSRAPGLSRLAFERAINTTLA
jgi:DNA-directed RNA polymerase alpha subunit